MLEPNFVPPDAELSRRETARREAAIESFVPKVEFSTVSIIVTGSMAYGQNFSVTEKSDVDLQLLLTPESAKRLSETGCFPTESVEHAVKAYRAGLVRQFSLEYFHDGVKMDCHFWDADAAIAAATLKSERTPRLRSSLAPSMDYAFSFDGREHAMTFTGIEIDGTIVSEFQSYRVVDGTHYFCRPVIGMLGCAYAMHGEAFAQSMINGSWRNVAAVLAQEAGGSVDLSRMSVFNCLPGKKKISEESREFIRQRTITELKAIGCGVLG